MSTLLEFFADRTIGYLSGLGWIWRGPGYDDGWDDPTREELVELHRLLGEYLDAH